MPNVLAIINSCWMISFGSFSIRFFRPCSYPLGFSIVCAVGNTESVESFLGRFTGSSKESPVKWGIGEKRCRA